mgnify:CR=1 FL=1
MWEALRFPVSGQAHIDILVEIPKTASMEYVKEVLTRHGYICMSERDNRKSFNKGYTENGFAERYFICICGIMGIMMSCIFVII